MAVCCWPNVRPENHRRGTGNFPAVKFEFGESPSEALARELHEELGVELDAAYPWITREHSYPQMKVRLHLYRVLRWHGEPQGREGQQVSWQDPRAISVEPLLSANYAIVQGIESAAGLRHHERIQARYR